MRKIGALVASAILGGVAAGCNAPKQSPEETRMYPKAPLEQMAPVITPEPTTAMSRLAHLNKPEVVLIPAESTAPAAAKK